MDRKEYDRREARKPLLVDSNLMTAIIDYQSPDYIEDEIKKTTLHIIPTQDMIDFYNLDMEKEYPTGVIAISVVKHSLRPILTDGTFGRKFLATDIFGREGVMTNLSNDILKDFEILEKKYTTQLFLNADLNEELTNFKTDLGKKFKDDAKLWKMKKGGGTDNGPQSEDEKEEN